MAIVGRLYHPPLVSVIITNFNFGKFLPDAVESVLLQTYPEIECIIVDDASTDDSNLVLDDILDKYPAIKIIKRSKNGDQLACCVDGFRQSLGQYIIFLDADDFLLEQCVSSHIFAHLSLEQPVGFTCCDMMQLVDDRLVLASTSGMAWFANSEHATKPNLRPVSEAIAGTWVTTGLDQTVADDIYEVDRTFRLWPWSATSGFLFRRDALNLLIEAPGVAELRRTPDGLFGRGINAFTGSAVINRPLAAWRAHGRNNFYQRAQLRNLRNSDIKKDGEIRHRRWLLNEVLRDPARFQISWPGMLKEVLETFDTSHPDPDAPSWIKGSYLSDLIVKHQGTLKDFLGEDVLMEWMAARGYPVESKEVPIVWTGGEFFDS